MPGEGLGVEGVGGACVGRVFDHMGGTYRIVGVARAYKQCLEKGWAGLGGAYCFVGGAYGHVGGADVMCVARVFKRCLEVEEVGGAGVGVAYRVVGVAHRFVGGAF